MKLRYSGLTMSLDHTDQDLKKGLSKKIGVPVDNILTLEVFRRSIDARKSPVVFSYTVDFTVVGDATKLMASKKIPLASTYDFTPVMDVAFNHRPVVVGFGPAGIFAAYYLAMAGLNPIVIERGQSVQERQQSVDLFWEKGILNPESNVQFGEGGAGAFSDGKLTTRIKDPLARYVFEVLVKHGAPEAILMDQKPHVGTDLLVDVVVSMRKQIEAWGGEIRFKTKMTALAIENDEIVGVETAHQAGFGTGAEIEKDFIKTGHVILAIGHSARDSYQKLFEQGVAMAAKPFAMGLRIEHPRTMIDSCQYGKDAGHVNLGAADYAVKANCEGRSVYSFCMCPGGHVINASSVEGHLVVNGMSYHARDAVNSNSALLVSISPEDFGGSDVLAGLRLQATLEKAAYDSAPTNKSQDFLYSAPVQLVGDFLADQTTTVLGSVTPSVTPGYHFVNFGSLLPSFMTDALRQALPQMGKQLQGFDRSDAVLTGIETRSSSPIRLIRQDDFASVNIKGLYPIGEGAGYAGGITSAAVDGIASVHGILTKLKAM